MLHGYTAFGCFADIADGNERIILGLIWQMIVKYQIESAIDPDDSDTGPGDRASC